MYICANTFVYTHITCCTLFPVYMAVTWNYQKDLATGDHFQLSSFIKPSVSTTYSHHTYTPLRYEKKIKNIYQ